MAEIGATAVLAWASGQSLPAACLRAARPLHWLKNLLVFVPVVAAQDFAADRLLGAALAFVAFGLCASAGYVVNDIRDARGDRADAVKQLRPIAAGALAVRDAWALAGLLLVSGFVVAAQLPPAFSLVLAGYLALGLAYTFTLKTNRFVDVSVLAVLYALRVLAGGGATGITVSWWLLLFALPLFAGLASVKRVAELAAAEPGVVPGASRRPYATTDLPLLQLLAVASAATAALVLACYAASAHAALIYARPHLLWLAAAVLLAWTLHLLRLAARGRIAGDPIVFAVRDRASLAAGLALTVTVVAASV